MSTRDIAQVTPLSLTVLDAARATGFSENYIRLLIVRRELPHVRVLVGDLEDFLQRHRQEDR